MTFQHELDGGVSGSCWKVIYKNGRFLICRDTVAIEKRVSRVRIVVIMIVTTVIDIYIYIYIYIYMCVSIYIGADRSSRQL